MDRPRHPKPAIESAVRYAEELGWRVDISNMDTHGGDFTAPTRRARDASSAYGRHRAVPITTLATSEKLSTSVRTKGCTNYRRGKSRMKPTETTSCEREYDFALIVGGVPTITSQVEDALFNAGCDDATLSMQYGLLYIEFSRPANSLQDAITSAIRNVRDAGIGAEVLRVDECNLVSASEIARRIQRSRQLVHQYITGQRGPGGFPPPECYLSDHAPLWAWCAVSHWLVQNQLIRPEESRNAEITEAINHWLEVERQRKRCPGLMDEISNALSL